MKNKILKKIRRYWNSIIIGAMTTVAWGAIFLVPFISSMVNGAKAENELYQINMTNIIAKEAYDFLYTFKKIKGTVAFKQMLESGNWWDCSINDINSNWNNTDNIDWYCVVHLVETASWLTLNHCTYSGGTPTETDINKISCIQNDATYPTSYYWRSWEDIINTIVLKKDITDWDIYEWYIKTENKTWISKVVSVIFY